MVPSTAGASVGTAPRASDESSVLTPIVGKLGDARRQEAPAGCDAGALWAASPGAASAWSIVSLVGVSALQARGLDDLPAGLRDHPRRVSGGEGRRRDPHGELGVRHRRRRGARAERRDRGAPRAGAGCSLSAPCRPWRRRRWLPGWSRSRRCGRRRGPTTQSRRSRAVVSPPALARSQARTPPTAA